MESNDLDLDALANEAVADLDEAPPAAGMPDKRRQIKGPVEFSTEDWMNNPLAPPADPLALLADYATKDLDLDALADQATADLDRGPVGEGYDWVKDKAQKAYDWAAPLVGKAVNTAKEAAMDIPGGIETLRGLETLVDVSDRVGGTVVGTGLELIASNSPYVLAADTLLKKAGYDKSLSEGLKITTNAKARMAQEGVDTSDPLNWRNWFPTSLVGDVGFPGGKALLAEPGRIIKENAKNKTLKEIGEVVEGLSGVSGIAGGVLAGANFDPLAILRFGQLTKAGIQAEKTGQLVSGVARSMEKGQRSLVEFGIGGMGMPRATFGSTNFGKLGPKVVDRLAEAATTSEIFSLPIGGGKTFTFNDLRNWARKFTTYSPLHRVNEALDNYGIEKNLNVAQTKKFFENVKAKALSLGLDIEDPAVRRSLYQKMENPSRHVMSEAEEAMANYLRRELELEVEMARAEGININQKKFDVKGAPVDAAESYVPRSANPSKVQQQKLAKLLSENEEAAALVDELQGLNVGHGSRNKFMQKRMLETREGANRIMRERYGIDDFFHDDIVQAYGDKLLEIKQARSDRRLVERMIREFGTSDVEYAESILNARKRVEFARAKGLIPDPDDVFISKLRAQDMVSLKDLPEAVRSRIAQVSDLGPDVAKSRNIRLPGIVADHVSEMLHIPQPGFLRAQLLGFQNAMKKFMFFNPGFHTRNLAENFTKAAAHGVGVIEHIKALMAITTGKGRYAKYMDEMLAQSRGLGLMSPMEHAAETALGRVKEFVFNDMKYTRAMLEKNPVNNFRDTVAQMRARGTFEDFMRELRKRGPDKALDAPGLKQVFRANAAIGERAELISKLAYFGKLMDAGYDARTAMIKTNRIFLNYERTRAATRTAQLAVPFANYMVKNLEVTMRMMAMNPQGFVTFGPNGAFEKAIHTWSGFDPRKVVEYRDMFGIDDMVFLPVMPMEEAIENEKDLLKKALFTHMKGAGEPGDQLWLKLPSNYHALKMWDPEKMEQNFGPLVRSAYIMLSGKDPRTGQALSENNIAMDLKLSDRAQRVIEEFGNVVYPRNVIEAVRGELNEKFPEIENHFMSMGLSGKVMQTILKGHEMDMNREKKYKKAIAKFKLLWNGGATQADVAFIAGLTATLNDTGKRINNKIKAYGNAKSSFSSIEGVVEDYYDAVDKVIRGLDLLEDYNKAISKMKDVPVVNQFSPEIEPIPGEAPADEPTDEEPVDPNEPGEVEGVLEDARLNDTINRSLASDFGTSQDEALSEMLGASQYDQNPFRAPQGIYESAFQVPMFDRATALIQRYLAQGSAPEQASRPVVDNFQIPTEDSSVMEFQDIPRAPENLRQVQTQGEAIAEDADFEQQLATLEDEELFKEVKMSKEEIRDFYKLSEEDQNNVRAAIRNQIRIMNDEGRSPQGGQDLSVKLTDQGLDVKGDYETKAFKGSLKERLDSRYEELKTLIKQRGGKPEEYKEDLEKILNDEAPLLMEQMLKNEDLLKTSLGRRDIASAVKKEKPTYQSQPKSKKIKYKRFSLEGKK